MRIELDRGQDVFFLGQRVAGRVLLEGAEVSQTGTLTVSLRCIVRTRLPQSRQQKAALTLHSADLRASRASPAAAFAFSLPRDGLPPSFHGRAGNVFFTVAAEIPSSAAFAVLPLTVLPLASADAPRLQRNAYREEDAPGWRGCLWLGGLCGGGPVSASLALPRIGWAPGEHVCFDVTVRGTLAPPASSPLAESGCACRTGGDVNGDASAAATAGEDDEWAWVSVRQLSVFHAESGDDAPISTESCVVRESVPPPHQQQQDGGSSSSVYSTRVCVRLPPCCPSVTRATAKLIEVSYFAVLNVRSGRSCIVLRVPMTVVTVPHGVSPDVLVAATLNPSSGGCSVAATTTTTAAPSALRRSVLIPAPPAEDAASAVQNAAAELPEPSDFEPFLKYAWMPMPPEQAPPQPQPPSTKSTKSTERSPLLEEGSQQQVVVVVVTAASSADAASQPFFCPPSSLTLV